MIVARLAGQVRQQVAILADTWANVRNARNRGGDMSASETTNQDTGSEQTETAVVTASEPTVDPITRLNELRSQVLPLLVAASDEYRGRSTAGYPLIVDNVERSGVFGITLSPNFGLYFMTDGTDLFTETHWMQLRVDALSMANTEKFAGRPEILREDIGDDYNFRDARRSMSRLQNRWNRQQTRIYRVDS